MGTFANIVKINAEHGGYAGAPAVAVIDAEASAVSLANRLQPLGVSSTNHNIVRIGEYITHVGVRARMQCTSITTMPSVNIYRLYGPESAFATTTLANDGSIQFDIVNHNAAYLAGGGSATYAETAQAFPFTGVFSTAGVTGARRDGTYLYSDWANCDTGAYSAQSDVAVVTQMSRMQFFIPTLGARAILVFHSIAANVAGGNNTCDVLVYPFASGSGE